MSQLRALLGRTGGSEIPLGVVRISSAAAGLCVLGHAIHQAPELLHHSLNQLLLVTIVLPELSKNVVLFARVSHSGGKKKGVRGGNGTDMLETPFEKGKPDY